LIQHLFQFLRRHLTKSRSNSTFKALQINYLRDLIDINSYADSRSRHYQ